MAEKRAERKVDATLPHPGTMTMSVSLTISVISISWSLADGKARFSSVIEQARAGPQVITRNGRLAAVVISIKEWDRRTGRSGTPVLVVRFLTNVDEDVLLLSVASLAELRRGIDAATADIWGRLTARRERTGRPLGEWIAGSRQLQRSQSGFDYAQRG